MIKNIIKTFFLFALLFLNFNLVYADSTSGCFDDDTVLMLHGNDFPDASTTMTDSSSSTKTATATGNAQTDTAQSKFAGLSMLFDGTGDYLNVTDSDDFAYGTGNFTIDFWVRFNLNTAQSFLYMHSNSGGNTNSLGLKIQGNSLIFEAIAAGTIVLQAATSPTLNTNTWYHIAIVRTGTTENALSIFVDGVSQAITWNPAMAADYSFVNYSQSLILGVWADGSSAPFNGWIDEFRIVKGTAVWTVNFTPPSAEYTDCDLVTCFDSKTKLMLHMNGSDTSTTFTDSECTAKTVTANGDAQIDTAQFKFSQSGLFDGTGDYLSVADSADWDFGTQDFTLDGWVRFNTVATANRGLLRIGSGYSGDGILLHLPSDSAAHVYIHDGSPVLSPTWNQSTATWYHFALVRYGTTLNLYIDGTSIGSVTNSTDISGGTSGVVIGKGDNNPIDGWMDEVRFTKGAALWTANFTPPAAEYSICTACPSRRRVCAIM